MPEPTFSTQLIGQTEKALNAILGRLLAGTGVSEPEWVILNITAMADVGSDAELTRRIAGTLKVETDVAAEQISELERRGFLAKSRDGLALSDTATEILTRIRTQVVELTGRLWSDIHDNDLGTAARVLALVLSRANDEIAALQEPR